MWSKCAAMLNIAGGGAAIGSRVWTRVSDINVLP
jgi:hypothetical protein